jgi:hypothetical protein
LFPKSKSADQTEWQAVLNGSAHVMAGTMDEEMAEEADQDLGDTIRTDDILEGKSRVLEYAQGNTTEIILERIEQLGEAYPFEHTANSLRYKRSKDGPPVYELLLGISQAASLTKGAFTELPRIFEQLCKTVCRMSLYASGSSIKSHLFGVQSSVLVSPSVTVTWCSTPSHTMPAWHHCDTSRQRTKAHRARFNRGDRHATYLRQYIKLQPAPHLRRMLWRARARPAGVPNLCDLGKSISSRDRLGQFVAPTMLGRVYAIGQQALGVVAGLAGLQ